MSFIGAIPTDIRRMVANYAGKVKHPVVVVGAGNFTIPAVLRSAGYKGNITACDITLYTTAVGAYLTDIEVGIAENPDCPETLKGLLRCGSPLETAASIALVYDLKQIWKEKNPFQKRSMDQYRAQWDVLVKKTMEKMAEYKKHLGKIDYRPQCGYALLKELSGQDLTIFSYPPIYKGDYERLDRLLTAVATWTPPDYTPLLDNDTRFYDLVKGFPAYLVVLYKDLPEVHDIIGKPASMVFSKGRGGNNLSIVARGFEKKYLIRHEIPSKTVGPYLDPDYEITGKETVSYLRITTDQSIRMNELFASTRISSFSGGVRLSVAFTLDGKVFGKADFCPSTFQWKLPEIRGRRSMVYVMSDLVIPHHTRKLTKLILLSLLSADIRQLLNRVLLEKYTYATTTAFSVHPASMKYRGVFKLHKRLDNENGTGYRLNYYAPFKEYPLVDALKIWKKRYGKKAK